jgi:hypothetical protein
MGLAWPEPTSTSTSGWKATGSPFDYTMRPGVVRQRNALALMPAVGINV